jgi:hypothetical protein
MMGELRVVRQNQWQRADQAIKFQRKEVSDAAMLFETRWTELALRRVDADLALRLHEQRNLFHAACLKGDVREVDLQGAALRRGYVAVTRRMEEAGAEDDAYQIGHDPLTGTKVAIGTQRAALDRVRKIHGQDVIWLTPDEVAVMMAGLESFKHIMAIKKKFPGAEIIRRYEDEGCSDHD